MKNNNTELFNNNSNILISIFNQLSDNDKDEIDDLWG